MPVSEAPASGPCIALQGARLTSAAFSAMNASSIQVSFVSAPVTLRLVSISEPIVMAPGGVTALKSPATRRSTSPIMNAARSRTSTTWIGSAAVPGTAISPPRAKRTGQYVNRSVGSSGPTM